MKQFLFSANGRLNRGPFWAGQFLLVGFALALCIVTLLLSLFWPGSTQGDSASLRMACIAIAMLLLWIVGLTLLVWAGICIGIKRFHDRDKSGVWVLIQFAPMIGGFWYFFEAGCLEGSSGPNRYGPDPLGRVALAPPPFGPAETLAAPSPIVASQPQGGRPGWVLPLMLVLAIPSFSMVAGAGATAISSMAWLKSAIQIEGTVIGPKPTLQATIDVTSNGGGPGTESGGTKTMSDGNRPLYRAIYQATTPEGEAFQVESKVSESPAPKLGSTVKLAYEPGHPQDAIVVSFPGYLLGPILVGMIGGALLIGWLLITLLVTVLWKRKRPVAFPHAF